MTTPTPDRALRNSRLKLLLIVAVFAAPMIAAGILTVSGWQPHAKGHGQPILPQRNLASEGARVTLPDGTIFPWRDTQPRMTLVALPGPQCAARCVELLAAMAKARVMLNRNQGRLRLLYLGQPPAGQTIDGIHLMLGANPDATWLLGVDTDGKFARYRPSTPDSVAAVLVESNGTALSFYPAGFDAAGLAQDLQKVIR